MANLDVIVTGTNGELVKDQLVAINTFDAQDWARDGIQINPNPRRTGQNGSINFYSGPPLASPIMVQATAQNGTSEPVPFDGTADVTVRVTLVPFA